MKILLAPVLFALCLTTNAAPIAAAPLATPVLIDSTGKVMGRFVEGSLLITINGETVALPLRPYAIAKDENGVVNSFTGYHPNSATGPYPRPGYDWQEAVVYFIRGKGFPDCNTSIQSRSFDLTATPSAGRAIRATSNPSRSSVAIFAQTRGEILADGVAVPPVMYASVSNRSPGVHLVTEIRDVRTIMSNGTTYVYGMDCRPIAAEEQMGDLNEGLVQETSIIKLSNIGIAPFYVK